jgi:HlyD family secretion protein
MMKDSKNKFTKALLTVAALILVGSVTACGLAGGAVPGRVTPGAVESGEVGATTITDEVESSGSVQPAQEASLTWKSSGVVAEVFVKAGDRVKAGDILAELELTSVPSNILSSQTELIHARQALEDLQPTVLAIVQAEQRIAAARDDVRDKQRIVDGLGTPSSKANIDQAKATVTLAKIKLDKAWEDFAPYQNKPENNVIRAGLYNKWAEAQQLYDQAVRRLNNLQGASVNQTDLDLAQANLDLAQANLEDAEQALAELRRGADPQDVAAVEARITAAEASLATIRITAPFDGEILVAEVQPGDVVNTSQAAFTLANREQLHVETLVDELEIYHVKVGDPVELTLDSLPGSTLTGKVSFINPVGQQVSGNVKYSVHVDLDDLDQPVLLGATADVNIEAGEPRRVVTVPVRSIQTDHDSEFVNVVLADGTIQRVDVVTGTLLGGQVIILSGDLESGQRVQLVTSNEMAEQMQQMNFMSGGGQ